MENSEFLSYMQQPFSRVKNLADRRILDELHQVFFRDIASAEHSTELIGKIFITSYQRWELDPKNTDAMAYLKLVIDRLVKDPGLAMNIADVSFLDPFSCHDPRLFHSLCKLAYAICRGASAQDASAFAQKILATPQVAKQMRDPMVTSYRLLFASIAETKEMDDKFLEVLKNAGTQTVCLYLEQIHSSDESLCQKIAAQYEYFLRSDSLHVRITAFSQINKFLSVDDALKRAISAAGELNRLGNVKLAGVEEVALLRSIGSRWPSLAKLIEFTKPLVSNAAVELKLNMIRKTIINSILNSSTINLDELPALEHFLEELRPSSELIADRLAACKCLLESSRSSHTRILIRKLVAANQICEKLRLRKADYTKKEILQAIVAVTQLGHPCYYRTGKFSHFITFGDDFGRKLWRFIFETRNRSTHKRQGAGHMIGRKLSGDVFIPSSILCEQVATDVPGEPVFDQHTGSWHSHLPLLDHLISTCSPWRRRRGYMIQTATVQTEVLPPSRLKGIPIWLWLSINFSKVAVLRNSDPAKYLEMLRRKCAFQFVFKDVSTSKGQPIYRAGVQSIIPLDVLYIANDFTQLNPFSALLLLVLIGFSIVVLHSRKSEKLRFSRDEFGLVIGGWGSRGKSGTERLKAALMTGLGYATFSKTTGTEATFLFSPRFGSLEEKPIFRPNGKATIWEQSDVVATAKSLHTDVFLWECMALNPEYVRTLQRDWMRDDLSTITNAYPDHEDIQGPTGIDVARTISQFVGDRTTVYTTEDLMLPVLEEAGAARQTQIENLGQERRVIITDEAIRLLNYSEHPSNLALVTRIGEDFDLSLNETFYYLGKYIKSDIGSLRIYPKIEIENRTIEFASGFSANEKISTLNNWKTCEMDSLPNGQKSSVLVNARSDRPQRCEVFAKLLVEDIRPDYVFVVGSGTDFFWRCVEKIDKSQLNSERWFKVPGDYQNHPNLLFRYIAQNVPEETSMRLLGIQNIKGVCLDSVHEYEKAYKDIKDFMEADEIAEKEKIVLDVKKSESLIRSAALKHLCINSFPELKL